MAVILLVPAGYYGYYGSRIKPGNSINSLSLSGKTYSEARQELQQKADDFRVTISPLVTKPLKASDVGLSFQVDKTLNELKSSSGFNPLSKKQASFKVKIDDKVLEDYLLSINKVTKAPLSAKVIVGTDGKVSIETDHKGSSQGIDPKEAKKLILAAAQQGNSVRLIPANYSSEAPISSSYANKVKTDIENIITTPVNLSIEGHAQSTAVAKVASWITITPHEDQKKIDFTIDSVKVSAYLDSVAKPYVKPPRAKVVTKNADGSVKVLTEGAPGTDITNKKEVAGELAASLNQKKSYTKELPVAYANPQTITAADYDKWIDVDLTNKRMYAYEHGTLVREFLVSAGAPATPTVKGSFTIKTKVRRQDMRGFNADGSTYFQPNVEYINYFYQDYAIHGNYWRPVSAFGHTNLSHGCVGITNSDAKWIYDWAPVGTEVITHD